MARRLRAHREALDHVGVGVAGEEQRLEHDETGRPDGRRPTVPGQRELAEQRLDLATALSAYTAGSAAVNHLDDTGVIRPGALADLALLDRDPFAGPTDQIATTRVLQTFVGGDRVFAADDA